MAGEKTAFFHEELWGLQADIAKPESGLRSMLLGAFLEETGCPIEECVLIRNVYSNACYYDRGGWHAVPRTLEVEAALERLPVLARLYHERSAIPATQAAVQIVVDQMSVSVRFVNREELWAGQFSR